MNERIEKLAMQANIHHDNFFDLNYKELDSFLEKFAELIVQECCEVAHCNFHVDGLTLGDILKEHFGVEE